MRSIALRKFEYNRFLFSRPSCGCGRLPFCSVHCRLFRYFWPGRQAGRHNHYLQSFGTVDRQLELHVRALALSIELLKCAPTLPFLSPSLCPFLSFSFAASRCHLRHCLWCSLACHNHYWQHLVSLYLHLPELPPPWIRSGLALCSFFVCERLILCLAM